MMLSEWLNNGLSNGRIEGRRRTRGSRGAPKEEGVEADVRKGGEARQRKKKKKGEKRKKNASGKKGRSREFKEKGREQEKMKHNDIKKGFLPIRRGKCHMKIIICLNQGHRFRKIH